MLDGAAVEAADEVVGEADAVVVDDDCAEEAGKEEGDGGRGTEAVVAEEAGEEEGGGQHQSERSGHSGEEDEPAEEAWHLVL